MDNSQFLSYTHGHVLQTVLNELLTNADDETTIQSCLAWLVEEKRNLLKKQPKIWDIPLSTKTYYESLTQIEEHLASGKPVSDLEALLEEVRSLTRDKIHILFLTQEPSCWPSLESVFYAAQVNDNVEPSLVYTPYFHVNYTEQVDYYDDYRAMGLPVLRYNEYDLPGDSPDVVFMIKPYGNTPEQYQFRELELVVPRTVFSPYGMEITVDLIKYGYQHYLHYKAWRHCAYGQIVKEYGTKYGYRNGENIAVWGHPKADLYRNLDASRGSIPEAWKSFIDGRKVILWTPHHLIDANSNGTGTWLIWGEKLLKLAFDNQDLVFIFRPHPLLFGALINSGAMSKDKYNEIRRKIDASPNILWDDTTDYRNAIYASDAIITDGTTFSIEYLYTKKPILLTPRNMEGFYHYEKMLCSYYIGKTFEDIASYIDMIRKGEDPLREQRLHFYEETLFLPNDGTVGDNIIDNVNKDLEMECSILPYFTRTLSPAKARESEKNFVIFEKSENEAAKEYPLLSVLVLCYNNTDLLYGMMDSIFQQDYPRIQLIISNDCSDDFDGEQVRAYIDQHRTSNIESVIVRKNKYNMRTVRHVRDALDMATGEYVVFTAADDRFVGETVFSKYIDAFLKQPDKYWLVAQCAVVSPDYVKTIYTTPTPADEPYFFSNNAMRLYSRWARRGLTVPCGMAWKKQAFEIVGGIDLEYQYVEDWPLELKLCRNGFAPIYLPIVTALHSSGGVTNSNKAYGKAVRRQFYEDKSRILKTEVEPFFDLMTPEDIKCYRQYQVEIMGRHKFLTIDWPDTTVVEKIKLLIKKPIAFIWLFEQVYVKKVNHFPRKIALLIANLLFMLSMLFLRFGKNVPMMSFFKALGYIDFWLSILIVLLAIVSFPLERYFKRKADLRSRLVN